MGAGLSQAEKAGCLVQARRQVVARLGVAQKEGRLGPVCIVPRSHLTVKSADGSRECRVTFRWIQASNGECALLVCVNGAHDWGDIVTRCMVALTEKE